MFEHKSQRLLPLPRFLGRLALSVLMAFAVVAFGLGIGVLGYHHFAGLPWIDAILNASMILTGMGPVDPLHTPAAKLFASAYALFSGVVFLSSVGIVLAPLFHRIIHMFHLDVSEQDEPPEPHSR